MPSAHLISNSAKEVSLGNDSVKHHGVQKKGVLCSVYSFFLDSWIVGYAALGVSLASLTGVLYILHSYDGSPLSSWRHLLSLNTVLSLLATTMKGSTMLATATALSQSKWLWFHASKRPLQDFTIFDDASRGPLGAAQLLVRLRMWHLASMGAIVTLLALLSDVFVQASATFPLKGINLGKSSLPISTDYTYNVTIVAGSDAGFMNVDPSLKSALYSGVLNGDSQSSSTVITPDCSTGNCTFAPYISLGICSDCQNVTAQLRQEPELASHLWTSSDSTFRLTDSTGADLVTLIQNYTTGSEVGLVNMTTVPGVIAASSDNTSVVLGLSNTSIITSTGPRNASTFRAFQCSLSVCVREYEASVQGGQLVETITDVVHSGWNATPSMPRWQLDDLGVLTLNKTLRNGQQASVSMDYLVWDGMNVYLGADSVGTGDSLEDSPGPFDGSGMVVNGSSPEGYAYFTNDFIQGFWAYSDTSDPDVPHIWDNIANSMTANIRVRSGNQASGAAQAYTSYVIVRWEFMIPPGVMVLLGLVFVLLTKWRSHLCGIPGWGANALADVAYAGGVALDISTLNDISSPIERPEIMLKASELQEWAEGKEARLRFRELGVHGWV